MQTTGSAESGTTTPAPPCTLVIFGGGGDLTKRLLMPALYDLARSRLLDDGLRILGVDHAAQDTATWAAGLSEMMQSFTKSAGSEFHVPSIDAQTWKWVADRLTYVQGDFEKPETYAAVRDALPRKDGSGDIVFYLAVAARFFGSVVDGLGASGLLAEKPDAFRRIIIEKPFGSDLPSAQALDARILAHAKETQIYRIDHFLGKEPVQSIAALRFANGMFEPMWCREHVDHVQITAAETIGVEGRGGFYEGTGALRDMVPNHLFQLLTMIAMEPPNSFAAEAVRTEKAKLVEAIRPITPENAVRGRYDAGEIGGAHVPGYREEPNVARDSRTETYAAVKLEIENRRWSGVPFYLRTGKRLGYRQTTIAVYFKPAPYRLFGEDPADRPAHNVLTLRIAPRTGMSQEFSAKIPGPKMRLGGVVTDFEYDDFFTEAANVGYETLIYDCMIGDATLFQRADNIEAAWAAVQPVIDAWNPEGEPEPYAAGSDGPAAADALLARDGRSWIPLRTATEPRPRRR